MTELDEALKLSRMLTRERKPLIVNDDYFEGEQPLRFVSPILERELGYRISPIVANIARHAVDVYDTRLDLKAFRFAESGDPDDNLWQMFEAVDGPHISQQATREGLALGNAYAMVSPTDGDTAPAPTAESPFEAIHEDDPRTHQVKHGLKKWTDLDKTRWMTYLHRDGWVSWRGKGGEWVEDKRETHDYGMCQLVPLPNDPRVLARTRPGRRDQRYGRAVFHDVIPILDALNKTASDMMVALEFHALPRRWATGLSEDDFVDEATGQQLETFSLMAGRLWGVESKEAKFGQFPEAELKNFHETIKLLEQMAGQLLGLPPHYAAFSESSGAPPSADAIRSAESQLVKRAERKQRVLGARWKQVMQLMLLADGNKVEGDLNTIEAQWYDPATPTIAQRADATVKLVQAQDSSGRSIVPIEQAREDLGYTQQAMERMRDWDEASMSDPALTSAMGALNASNGRV